MQIVKALVGGLIGGAVGVVLSNGLQSAYKLADPWSLPLVGLGAGLGVLLLCGKDRNFATGAIAAVASIVALLGLSFANSMVVLSSAEDTSQPVLRQRSSDDIAEEETATEQETSDDMEADDAEKDQETADEASDDMEADDADDVKNNEEGSDKGTEDSGDAVAEGKDDSGKDEGAPKESVPDQRRLPTDSAVAPSESQQVDWKSSEVILQAVSALLAYFVGAGWGKPATANGGQSGASDKSEGE